MRMATQSDLQIHERTVVEDCLQKLASARPSGHPLSTYRLQFHKDFRFTDAIAIIPYLNRLGISHVYASPILKARAGSTHGYDITDHNLINPEIGSEDEFRRFVNELHAHHMGLILDTVPNHMGVGRGDNPWWQDVLANGQAAEHADFFDIDWDPLKPELHDKLLLPILGNQYGEELESGHIRVEFDPESGFLLRYYETTLPIDPQTIPLIFAPALGTADAQARSVLEPLLHDLQGLPLHSESDPGRIRERQQSLPALVSRLRAMVGSDPDVRHVTNRALASINGRAGESASFDSLHNLLEAQVYRLAHWRVSAEEINYRRFFDINELVGVRMENPRVFAETHRLLRRLLSDGSISGVRIDHCDGLLNPRQYFIRLQMLYAAAHCCGADPQPPLAENGIEIEVQRTFGDAAASGSAPLYTVVEKILEPGEDLPIEWPVHGTSGYDFTNLVNGIFIQREHERAFTDIYNRFLGYSPDIEQIIYESKKLVMNTALSSEVNVLAHMLDEISSTDRHARDYTRKALRDAIRETIACFPVYRSYIDERGEVNERDRIYINTAISRAKRRNSGTAAGVFHFLRDILLQSGRDNSNGRGIDTEGYWKSADYDLYRRKLLFTLKFQQLTGPVMAKGLEDTACYTYNRFVSMNEVGSSPKEFGKPLEEFHKGNQMRATEWPSSMLALSTHDTKRSEDVRARLNVLSEMPKAWAAAVSRWQRANRAKRGTLADGRVAPDNNEEYLLYQTLAGAWPFDLNIQDEAVRNTFVERIQQYMVKCLHEAKVNLSWINPDQEYVDAVSGFIADILTPASETRAGLFLNSLQTFLEPVKYFGAINSLVQKALHLTAPGIPDLYQGTDLWDLSLVDPDNRRPVDFAQRQQTLQTVSSSSSEHAQLCSELLTSISDGRIKMHVIERILCLRRERPELFREAEYHPLAVTGEQANHVVAFMRRSAKQKMLVIAPRFSFTLMKGKIAPPLGDVWENTSIEVPEDCRGDHAELFSAANLTAADGKLPLKQVFAHFPVAVLLQA